MMTPGGVQLHGGPDSNVDRPSRNHGHVVRLAVLAIEEILAAQVYRESAVQAFAHTRAESSHTAVLQPVIAKLLTHQLRVGLRGIRECSCKRDTIVIDPVPRSRCRERARPSSADTRRR